VDQHLPFLKGILVNIKNPESLFACEEINKIRKTHQKTTSWKKGIIFQKNFIFVSFHPFVFEGVHP